MHESPELWLVLNVWETFGGSTVAHDWLLGALKKPEAVTAIGMLMGGLVRSTSEPHRYHQFSAGNVTSVIQPAEIVPAVEDLLKKGSILPEQREALEQIVAGAKKWLTLGSANADERAE